MKYYLDTEFIENGMTIDLISIGAVCEDGREFYAESLDADLSKADQWVKDNVISHLWAKQKDKRHFNAWSRDGGTGGLLRRDEIKHALLRFIGKDKPIFFGYFADYDWVAICQLFGRMIDLPKHFPMYCMDLRQTMEATGLNDEWKEKTVPQTNEHCALEDAKWNKALHEAINSFTI